MDADEIRRTKRRIYQNLNPYPAESIPYPSSLYVPRYEVENDPIEQLRSKIYLTGEDSMQFLSGCSGTGKTTELHRLASLLKGDGYIVFHADALDYLNPAQPIEIEELLVVIGAAFSEHAEAYLGKDHAREGYLERFWNYLNQTEVEPEEFGIGIGGEIAQAEFKAKLRTTDTFRQLIRKALNGRLDEHKARLDRFITEAIGWLRQKSPDNAGVVLLFDSLERLRGSASEEALVMTSVEKLFTHHRDLLRVADLHLVYTVPPWLRYISPGAVKLEKTLPCVKLWTYRDDDGAPEPYGHGWSIMRQFIEKRVTADWMPAVFGPPDNEGRYTLLDDLIAHCGGHFRDLLYLVQEALTSAPTLQLRESDIEIAKGDLRAQYSIDEDSAEWLAKIADTHQDCRPNSDAATVAAFTRFLDNHLVLLFSNGRDWYDIHPIIVDEVRRVAQRVHAEKSRAVTAG